MTRVESRVAAIVVMYYPERERVMGLLDALEPQVGRIVVADNTPEPELHHVELIEETRRRYGNLEFHRLGRNLGIAAALNYGIERAIEAGFEFVYLSDQDSEPEKGMIRGLLDCHAALVAEGVQVGCVCPAYHDSTTDALFNFQAYMPGHYFYRSVPAGKARPWMEIITTISSGSLIPCQVLKAVGSMREDFFIDDVDTEWCHRARYHGYKIFGTSSVLLHHRLGDDVFYIWVFRWKPHNLYSPTRLYYRFRNFVLMGRLPHVPRRWLVRASWYWVGNLYAYVFFAPGKVVNIKAIVLGLYDGALGKSGPCRRKF